ncbi:MAG: hypothetical protein IJW19_07715 [Clostridia bacterium]|nr:hypothetical protein [Clostridia bacterium]
MFKLLLKTRFSMFFASLTQGKKKKNKSTAGKVLMIILFAFVGLYVMGAMFALFTGMSIITSGTDQEFFVFSLALLVAIALTLFGSIFPTKTQIFDSKDNELLLSLPIPPKYIFTSRLVFLLIINYMLESVIMIPAIITFGIFIGYSLTGFLFTVLVYLLIPFLTLSVSSLIAWIVSLIASKIKNKTLVTVGLFALFFGAYMYFMGSLGFSSGSGELHDIDFSGFKDVFLIGWGANAMTYGNGIDFLLFLACCVIPGALAYFLLNRSFVKIITTKRGRAKTKYKEKRENAEGVFITLIKKEMKRFVTSSAYILNEGMGILMMVIFTVMISVMGKDLVPAIEGSGFEFVVEPIIFGLLAFGASMIIISTPSISLEDKHLWILQSLPVRGAHVLLAKVASHIIIGAPAGVICSVILSVVFKLSILEVIVLVISVIAITAFGAYFGMLLGLLFPKFDWQNENVAVKQGFAVFGSMLGGMLWAFIMTGVVFLMSFISFLLGALTVTVINAGVCVAIHMYFLHGGERKFALLKQ